MYVLYDRASLFDFAFVRVLVGFMIIYTIVKQIRLDMLLLRDVQ